MTSAVPGTLRTVLPLATITCTSMLAMDFYLPAVPSLEGWFGVDVTVAQATISVFLVGLAASQILWAEIMSRWGPRTSVQAGVLLLIATSIVAAIAPDIEVLLAARLVQGIGAGAATVVAPSVVRATLPDVEAVRGIAAISMVEAVVPALGPVLGALLLVYTDWRATFVVLAVVTLLALPFAVRAAPRELPGLDRSVVATYRRVVANRKFTRLALSHALGMGALLTFVASAPQLMTRGRFGLLQVIGVAAFMIFASQAARISQRITSGRAVQLGAIVQLLVCGAMLAASRVWHLPYVAFAAFWFVFCGALAVRGPAAFSEALDLPPAQLGRGSALMVLAILAAGAIGTQVVAPSLAGASPTGLLVGLTTACAASLALVVPYPRRVA